MNKQHTTSEPDHTDELTEREFEEVTDVVALDDEDIDVVDDEEAVETARIKAELQEKERDRSSGD